MNEGKSKADDKVEILIVEDSPKQAALLEHLLTRARVLGYGCQQRQARPLCGSPGEACTHYHRRADPRC